MKKTRLTHTITPVALLLFFTLHLALAQPQQDPAKIKQGHKTAQQMMRDGLYTPAESFLKNLLEKYPGNASSHEWLLWLGQAQYYQGHYDAAAATLKSLLAANPTPEFHRQALFISAESLASSSRWKEAEDHYLRLVESSQESPDISRAHLGLAWVMLHQGKGTEAEHLLSTLSDKNADTAIAQTARIFWARWLISDGRSLEAKPVLELLIQNKPEPAARLEANMWLGEIALAREDFAAALTYFQVLTLDKKAHPQSVLMQSWLGQGKASAALRNWTDATTAFESVVLGSENEELRIEAVRRSIETARASGQLASVLDRLRTLVAERPKTAAAAACLLAIGEAQLADDLTDDATATFETVVRDFPDSGWQGLARHRLAEIHTASGRTDSAIKLLQMATQNPNNAFAKESLFLLGEILFSRGAYEEASQSFLKLSENPGADALKEKALFNTLLCFARLNREKEFQTWLTKFTFLFPQSVLRDQLLDEFANLYTRLGLHAKAREQWTALLDKFPKSLLRSKAALSAARSLYYEGKLAEADAWLSKSSALITDSMDQVTASYLRICIAYQLGSSDAAKIIEDIQTLVPRAPAQHLAVEMKFKMAQIYFEKQDFPAAQTQFLNLASAHPKHHLAEESLYFAGLAAMRRQDSQEAVTLMEKLAKLYPSTHLLWDARAAQGHALRVQGKFAEALTVYESILADAPKGDAAAVLTQIGKGDCLYRLASDDKKKYPLALKAYEAVTRNNSSPERAWLEASVKRAQCLEQMGKTPDALHTYFEVIYRRYEQPAPDSPPDYQWFGRAVADAGRILENSTDWKGAIALYQLAEKNGGPESKAWRDRRLKIQREHFIYPESEVPAEAGATTTKTGS